MHRRIRGDSETTTFKLARGGGAGGAEISQCLSFSKCFTQIRENLYVIFTCVTAGFMYLSENLYNE